MTSIRCLLLNIEQNFLAFGTCCMEFCIAEFLLLAWIPTYESQHINQWRSWVGCGRALLCPSTCRLSQSSTCPAPSAWVNPRLLNILGLFCCLFKYLLLPFCQAVTYHDLDFSCVELSNESSEAYTRFQRYIRSVLQEGDVQQPWCTENCFGDHGLSCSDKLHAQGYWDWLQLFSSPIMAFKSVECLYACSTRYTSALQKCFNEKLSMGLLLFGRYWRIWSQTIPTVVPCWCNYYCGTLDWFSRAYFLHDYAQWRNNPKSRLWTIYCILFAFLLASSLTFNIREYFIA